MLVLDTHIWLWWSALPDLLSARAADAIDVAETIGISAISCWEVAMLARKRRIGILQVGDARNWIAAALREPRTELIPVTSEIALDAGMLEEGLHGDPADRLIYATARARAARLVTKDAGLRDFDPRGTVW